jgi:hypothetical protein
MHLHKLSHENTNFITLIINQQMHLHKISHENTHFITLIINQQMHLYKISHKKSVHLLVNNWSDSTKCTVQQ